MPKEYSIDDDTEDINWEPKTDIVEVDGDVSDRILKVPDSQLDISQCFSIGSIVGHDDQSQICEGMKTLSLSENKFIHFT